MLKNLIFYSTVLELKRGENIYSFIFPLLPTCFFYFLSENLKQNEKLEPRGWLSQESCLLPRLGNLCSIYTELVDRTDFTHLSSDLHMSVKMHTLHIHTSSHMLTETI